MAEVTVRTSHHGTLVASTVDTVKFTTRPRAVELRNFSTTAVIYCRVDGTAPTVAGDDTYRLGSEETLQVDLIKWVEPPQVQLISSGTPAYSVTAIA